MLWSPGDRPLPFWGESHDTVGPHADGVDNGGEPGDEDLRPHQHRCLLIPNPQALLQQYEDLLFFVGRPE